MEACLRQLEEFGIESELCVCSAHRDPAGVMEWASSARQRGLKVVIAAAGGAAHLPGVVAAWTDLPVVGVPIPTQHLGGVDSLYSIVPLPAGIPVATMEAFGGATFETWLEQGDNPWDFLRRLNEVTPKTPVQALIRGQNLVGHRNYPDDVVELFVRHAARCGVDVFRVFDPLNDLRNMEVAIRTAKRAKRRVQGALCYAVSPAHSLELWLSLAKGLVELGADEIVIKDTSGLLSP